MKWKEIIIGAIASLLVTVLGGIAIYYVTKEKNSEEALYHIKRGTSSFKSDSQKLSIVPVEIVNLGGTPAKSVFVTVVFEKAAIKDHTVESKTSIKPNKTSTSNSKLELQFDSLLANERFTINILTSTEENPKVVLKSSKTLGSSVSEFNLLETRSNTNTFLEKAIPLIGVTYIFFIILFARRIRGLIRPYTRSINDFGFL